MDDPEIAFPCDPRVSGRNFHDTTFPNPPVSDEGKGEFVIGVSIPLFPSTPAPPPHPPPPTSQTPGVTTSRVLISTPLPLFPFHPHSFLLSPEEENSSTPLPYFPFYPISFIPFSPHRPPLLHKKGKRRGSVELSVGHASVNYGYRSVRQFPLFQNTSRKICTIGSEVFVGSA